MHLYRHYSAFSTVAKFITIIKPMSYLLLLHLTLNFLAVNSASAAQVAPESDLIFKSSSSANLKSHAAANLSAFKPSSTPLLATEVHISRQLTSRQCPPQLEGRCQCGMGTFAQNRPTYITNCTNAGFGRANDKPPTHYLQAIDNRTEVLIFTGNHFPELPANLLLLNRSYDQLHTVDLSNNNISTVHGKAFHNMHSVRVLHLSDNRLRITGSDPPDTPTLAVQKPKSRIHHKRPHINPIAVMIGDRGEGSRIGDSIQDVGADMQFNTDDREEEEVDEQLLGGNAQTEGEQLAEMIAHPRMFSPLRSLEQLHLRNAFELRHFQRAEKKNIKEPFADSEAENRASQALVAALGEVFRQSNLSTLKLLNLESNGLTSFESTQPGSSSSFFCALPRLQHLQLAYNRLTGYPLNGSCLHWLSSVDLTGNRIQTIDSRSLALIRSSGPALGALHLNLARNPFRCDCALLPFFRFLSAANSETGDPRQSPKFESLPEYRCYFHSKNGSGNDIAGQYFDDLSEADFGDCTVVAPGSINPSWIIMPEYNEHVKAEFEAIRRYRYYITLSYIVLTVLLLLLALLLAILAYTNRAWIISTWNYFLLEMNYPKSDYTVLDAKDDSAAGGGGGDHDDQMVDGNCDAERQLSGEPSTLSDSEKIMTVNENEEIVSESNLNGSTSKRNNNKGKNSKKFNGRQSNLNSSQPANRSNHIRMRELKGGKNSNVAEEQV